MTAVRDWKPHAIIHTAYRKDDRLSIVDASEHVARAALSVGARLVHVSTDALFKGQLARYTEVDPPHPITQYGIDKANAEVRVAAVDPQAVIVRTSLMIGVDDQSIHEETVRRAITGDAPMTFFTDEYRSPVLVTDLAATLTDLAAMPEPTAILNIGGPEPQRLGHVATAVFDARRVRSGAPVQGRARLDEGRTPRSGSTWPNGLAVVPAYPPLTRSLAAGSSQLAIPV